jgi:MFS family permease
MVFSVCAALVLRVPETTSRRPGAFKSLVPRVSVAPRARPGFVRGLPLLLVVWALCGFFIALAPSLLLHVFGVDSGGLDGLTVAVLCGAGAVSPTLLGSLRPSTSAAIGMVAISVGLVILLASLGIRSLGLFFVGAAIAGAGSGAAFSGLVQSLAPLADAHERAELFAAIFVATYLSLSLPPILAGFLIASFGFVQTTQAYLAVLLVVAIAGAGIQWFASRRRFGA